MGTWRRWRPSWSWRWAWAPAAILLAPAAADAQLFPNIYIKRERPCCAAEDPRYRIIREQYFGYYPTCWRRFPPGWGCPSPDAPNWEAELKRMPLEFPPGLEPLEGAPRDDPFAPGGGGAAGERPALPPKPEGGSLFDMTPTPPAGDDLGLPPAGDELDPFTGRPRGSGSGVPAPAPPSGPGVGRPPASDLGLPPAGDLGLPPAPGIGPGASLPAAGGDEALPLPVEEASLPAPGGIETPGATPAPTLPTTSAAPGEPTAAMPPDLAPPGSSLLGATPAAPNLAPPIGPAPGSMPPMMVPETILGNPSAARPPFVDGMDGPAPGHTHNHDPRPVRRGPIASMIDRIKRR